MLAERREMQKVNERKKEKEKRNWNYVEEDDKTMKQIPIEI